MSILLLYTTQVVFFNVKIFFFPHKRLYEMQRHTKSKLFLRVILIILNWDSEKRDTTNYVTVSDALYPLGINSECISTGKYTLIFLHLQLYDMQGLK